MITASISEAKAKLSALLDRVRAGETVTITDRGVPVARIVRAPAGDDAARLALLERAGLIRRGRGRLVPELLEPGPKARTSVVDALLEERREGR